MVEEWKETTGEDRSPDAIKCRVDRLIRSNRPDDGQAPQQNQQNHQRCPRGAERVMRHLETVRKSLNPSNYGRRKLVCVAGDELELSANSAVNFHL